MNVSLWKVNDLNSLHGYIDTCTPRIRKWGGRVLSLDGQQVKLNQICKKLQRLATNNPSEAETIEIAKKIRALSNQKVTYKNAFQKQSSLIRQFFGNLFYDREKILDQLQFPKKTPVTTRGGYRYVPLQGETGEVSCRVYGQGKKTIPRISPNGRVECSTRSIARLRNLIVVRGANAGARMIGPCAYYGNLEKPHRYDFTMDIDEYGVPTFFRHIRRPGNDSVDMKKDFTGKSVEINAWWHKGTSDNIKEIQEKYAKENQKAVGASLFPNSGILEVDQAEIDLPYFDATQLDLSSFKARLVKNDVPFSIVHTKISANDEFRPVSYYFDKNYCHEQIQEGGGLFLETHDFPQTMSPLDETADGFVVLGKWKSDDKLELIGIKIPFGYTLIIEKGCIHGDVTLTGFYVMAMTSNHKTMSTADTVFIKDQNSFKNFMITMNDAPLLDHVTLRPATPIARFDQKDKTYKERLKSGGIPIFNPNKTGNYPWFEKK